MNENKYGNLLDKYLDGGKKYTSPILSKEAQKYVALYRTCARIATSSIRREQIPPQSPLAYHCFVRVCKLMFCLGVSVRLKHLGYSLQKVDL